MGFASKASKKNTEDVDILGKKVDYAPPQLPKKAAKRGEPKSSGPSDFCRICASSLAIL